MIFDTFLELKSLLVRTLDKVIKNKVFVISKNVKALLMESRIFRLIFMKHSMIEKNKEQISEQQIERRRSLAPCILDKGEPAYESVEELAYAISLPECKNIAITGIFGSGKSSIIDTYLNLNGDKKVLRISLSNFNDSEITDSESQEYENGIEFKLFQHIIFKANADKTQRSRYKRIILEDKSKNKKDTMYIFLFILCFIVVFEPKVLQIDSFYKAYFFIFRSWADVVNVIFDIVASCTMVFIAFKAVSNLISCYKHINIRSLKAKEFEINFKEEKSVFNKLLDEILYYFKSGDYDLIVFEDLDRISNPKTLFLKLREINILLNESDYYITNKKQIKFLYAIKDDIFQEEVRTKCFDYIIPVIPIVNSFNGGEYLLKNYPDELNDISITDVKRLGVYISRMRDLINIMNEYMIYKKTIFKDPMSAKKLLAMTIYKNLYPTDYSETHSKVGALYFAFFNKKVFSNQLTKDKKDVIIQCNDTINKEREKITSIRKIILDRLHNKDGITHLVINGFKYSLLEIAESDSLYDKFRNNKAENWIIDSTPDSEVGKYNYLFKDILSDVDTDGLFDENIEMYQRNIAVHSEKKRNLEKQIYSIESNSLCELMKLCGDGVHSKNLLVEAINKNKADVDDSIVDTLHAMILSGYISDDFMTYITYTHTGSFDEQDFKFMQSVIQRIPLEYDFKLNHIDAFIDNFLTNDYDSKSILNFDFLNFLLKNNLSARIDNFIETTRKNPDFIVQYIAIQGWNEMFLKHLFNCWHGCIKLIAEIIDNELRADMLRILYRYASTDFHVSTDEIDFISTQYKFIADDIKNCNLKKMNAFFGVHKVVFKELVEPNTSSKSFFDSIVSRNQYEINLNNLIIIYGSDFTTKSYTTIMNGSEPTKSYVLRNIRNVVNLFPETDIDESVEAIANLSQDKSIGDNIFEKFISRQNNIISNFNNVGKERIPIFFKYDKVKATWDNIQMYFTVSDDLNALTPYIVKHANELAGTKINEDDDKKLQLLLLTDNSTLSYEVFKALLPSFEYYFDTSEISNLDESRLLVVLDKGYIEYNQDSKELYASKSTEVWGEYLVHFFSDFVNDENFGLTISNKTAIHILNSSLSIEQKKIFIDKLACPLDEDGIDEYSHLICFYYLQMVIDDDTNLNILIKALSNCNDKLSWKQKIDLINRINQYYPYNKTQETALLNSLGGGYLSLNSYRGVSHFDNNIENHALLNFLLDNGHYVNKIKEENDGLKVTFKNPPSDE